MKQIMTVAVLTAALAWALPAGAENLKSPAAPADGFAYTLKVPGQEEKIITADLMIPLRETAETLGFTVTWDKGKTTVDNGTIRITVTPGETRYTLSEGKDNPKETAGTLSAAPYLRDHVTYVPASLLTVLLGNDSGLVRVDGNALVLGEKPDMPTEETAEIEAADAPAPAASAEPKAPATAAVPPEEQVSVKVANPFEDCTSIEEAEKIAGFPLTLPARTDTAVYRAIQDELIEVIYYGKDGEETLRVRKGKKPGDVSGDYNAYAVIKTIAVGGVNTRMKGEGRRMSLAVWSRDGHGYSVSAAAPLTIEDMTALVETIQ